MIPDIGLQCLRSSTAMYISQSGLALLFPSAALTDGLFKA